MSVKRGDNMAGLVKIKGMRDGIVIKLDAEADFSDVYNELCDKFRESTNYFKDASLIIGFEGRKITPEEEDKLIDGINLNSDINILCVIGEDEEKNLRFLRAKSHFDKISSNADSPFYKGTLRSHEHLETDQSVIILGDVNPGAVVSSKGNIVILGTLYGTAHAGAGGNTSAFVVTLDMKSSRIGVSDVMSEIVFRSSVFTKNKVIPRISFLEGREIVTEEITRELLNMISTNLN